VLLISMMFILTLFLSTFRLALSGFPMPDTLFILMVIVFSTVTFLMIARLTRDKEHNSNKSKWAARGAVVGSLTGAPLLYFLNIEVSVALLNYFFACASGLFLSVLINNLFLNRKNA
jgi:hypothetical protein